MHELAVTTTLVQMIVSECTSKKIANPKKIFVDLGFFTSYSKDSILFYYDLLKREEPFLRKTKLIINEIPGKISCKQCNKESVLKDAFMMCCPYCYSMDVEIRAGREFILKEIETG